MGFQVRFWGVRGSIACPTPDHVHFGGNTSCVEFQMGHTHLIMDAGTGLRQLGRRLLKRGIGQATLLLSHTHWDHIDGFPFFAPIHHPSFSLTVLAGHLGGEPGALRRAIDTQMSNPYFPVPIEALQGRLNFEDFRAGDTFELGEGIRVATTPLNHPGGATGYRVNYRGRSVCYVTDTEHRPGQRDEKVLELIEGADLVIYDGTFTDEEFPMRVGWGHSTWEEGVRLCREAEVRRLAIFHHAPEHNDRFMARLEKRAIRSWKGAMVAREGMRLPMGK